VQVPPIIRPYLLNVQVAPNDLTVFIKCAGSFNDLNVFIKCAGSSNDLNVFIKCAGSSNDLNVFIKCAGSSNDSGESSRSVSTLGNFEFSNSNFKPGPSSIVKVCSIYLKGL